MFIPLTNRTEGVNLEFGGGLFLPEGPPPKSRFYVYRIMPTDNRRISDELLDDLFSSEQTAFFMKAFCDESGKHEAAKVITIAGLLISVDTCKELQRRWMKEAARKPKIPLPFHMSDCVNGSKLFEPWRDQEDIRLEMQRRMIKTMRGLGLHAYGASAVRAGFKPVAADLRRSEAFRDPWFHVFESAIQEIMIRSKEVGKPHEISFVFDRQDEFKPRAHQLYDEILALKDCDYIDRMGSLTFSPKDKVAALQAIDIIAYEMYRDACDRKLDGKPSRWQCDMIRQYATVNGAFWDAEGLRWLRDEVIKARTAKESEINHGGADSTKA